MHTEVVSDSEQKAAASSAQPTQMLTIGEVLNKTTQFFKNKNFESPRFDAELILSHVLKLPRIQLYAQFNRPLTIHEIEISRDLVRRRSQGEPVAYLVGTKWFYQSEFLVNSSLDSFIRKITFQEITKTGIQKLGPVIEEMAEAEELFAHKNAVTIRLKKLKNKN